MKKDRGDFAMAYLRSALGTLNGQTVEKITLQNSARFSMELLTLGAALRAFTLPNGLDVCLGYDSLRAYCLDDCYFGATIGRNSNRIAGAAFMLNGRRYALSANEGNNQLHGGAQGFHRRLWKAEPSERAVRFSRISPDGEEGFPGTVSAFVTYTILDDGYSIDYEAVTDRDTIVNLTNHTYFNLAGQGNGTILDHVLTMPAAFAYLPIDAEWIPTGEQRPTANTAMDFSSPAVIRDRIDDPLLEPTHGYDHHFALRGDGMRLAAVVSCPRTGVTMTLETNMEGVQFYTGNGLDGRSGKGGARYDRHGGFCLETQRYPNAVNEPTFPSAVLKAGETYRHRSVFRFSL